MCYMKQTLLKEIRHFNNTLAHHHQKSNHVALLAGPSDPRKLHRGSTLGQTHLAFSPPLSLPYEMRYRPYLMSFPGAFQECSCRLSITDAVI